MGVMTTFSGRAFDIMNPSPGQIDIIDIAHSLSNLCRYNGHSKQFYSVAQHSIILAYSMNSESDKRNALMHDATEAYMTDIHRPLKVELPQIKQIENNIWYAICDRFSLQNSSSVVLNKDYLMPYWEIQYVCTYNHFGAKVPDDLYNAANDAFKGIHFPGFWTPVEAERCFLEYYNLYFNIDNDKVKERVEQLCRKTI